MAKGDPFDERQYWALLLNRRLSKTWRPNNQGLVDWLAKRDRRSTLFGYLAGMAAQLPAAAAPYREVLADAA